MSKSSLDFSIRKCEKEDSYALISLCDQLGYSISIDKLKLQLKVILNDEEQIVYVAETSEDTIIGWFHGFIYRVFYVDTITEIGGLVVDKIYRSKGVGKNLMKKVEYWGKQKDCTIISLRSNEKRKEAHEFYQKIGYENVKTQYTFRKKLSNK